ncbi:acetyl-CoA C-acyltransferase [Agrobacterium fabrum]|uniref:acetyl-CoA C-acyltransferase n=1 Tax=Agrobacterium fabrum TaxID=1176649 RepID=UPI001573ADBF|nr:acetyl-CoA C-acyltransferase [Agrobacterium fabrum]WCK80160.1 acetyl-CoA C-acyltransferase [Agrobacterium fabrum]
METERDPIVIISAARTPIGSFQGSLKNYQATDLGGIAVSEALRRASVRPDDVDELLMGCVLPAGLGQAPARQAAHNAGLPWSVPCSTVNKVCGSGMKTIMMAHDALAVGSAGLVVAGGMESMTNAPYLLEKHRAGARMGHGRVIDHMFLDGLEDAYDRGRSMGTFAEQTAKAYQFTRTDQDAYAMESLDRATKAIADGAFRNEIVAVGELSSDEQPGKAKRDKIPQLRPAFKDDGTITAASSASISDGAAAVILTRLSVAEKLGAEPLAVVRGTGGFAQEPGLFTTAPIFAIRGLLDNVGWNPSDVDLFEVNEAFAVVPMAVMRDLAIPHEKLNVNGGACALGHPLGCSGTRVVVTLLSAMKDRGLRKGVASLCIGGGEATAVAVELFH